MNTLKFSSYLIGDLGEEVGGESRQVEEHVPDRSLRLTSMSKSKARNGESAERGIDVEIQK